MKKKMMIEKIFKELSGAWIVSRDIAPGGLFEGEASFTPRSAHETLYREEGNLTLDNCNVLTGVQKQYIYRLEEGQISVYFDDGPEKGKLFHILNFNDNEATAEHLCSNDLYKTRYAFKLPEKFTIHHCVKGPEKDYSISTRYIKHRACLPL